MITQMAEMELNHTLDIFMFIYDIRHGGCEIGLKHRYSYFT